MSAATKGKQVIWGVSAGAVTAANVAVSGGIIVSFDTDSSGATTIISDEDDDAVTRIDHNTQNKITMEVMCVTGTSRPLKGAELSGLGTIDGINFGTGRVFVDSSKVTYANAAAKKLSVTATHYPVMLGDA